MPSAEATKPQNHLVRRVVSINADANGNLPTRIELVKAGMWPEMSNKGALWIKPTDLIEMKQNFDKNIGTPGKSGQIAIDFMHADYDKAGCWIHAMEVEGDALWGTELEFTASGTAAIQGGDFKFFSPSFYPACLGEWTDPEDWSITAQNVIVGGAFTNIPFFKDLQPVKASQTQEGDKEDTIYVDASSERSNMPTLDEVRVKAADTLTSEDKTLLEENKAKLSADELKKFSMEEKVTPKVESSTMTEEQKEAAQIQADIRSGKKVLVDASEHDSLKASVAKLEASKLEADKEKASSIVEAGIKVGKIIADQKDFWVEQIVANPVMADAFEKLPVNKVLEADAIGNGGGDVTADAIGEVNSRAEKLMADDKNLNIKDAIKQVKAADSELADRFDAARKAARE